ncbi:unnamed protein product [Caenorhabditis brenneri]
MDVPRFPLTRLPVSCAKNVIRAMSPLQLVVFSLLSKKCKNQANSLKTPTKPMTIHFARGLVITIYIQQDILRIGFYESRHREEDKKQLSTPRKVSLAIQRDGRFVEKCIYNTNRHEVREWVETLLFIFPESNDIWMNFVDQGFRFNLDPIKEIFPNIHKLSIAHTGNYTFNHSVLQKFLPVEDVTIQMDSFEHSRISHKFLIQNFTFTGVSVKVIPRITLNELLINYSKKITLVDPQINRKDLNRFFKLWIDGANPRLEYLQIFKTTGIGYNSKAVVKGIAHHRTSNTLTRTFKHYQGESRIHGGVDFHRKDGIKATINISNRPGRKYFGMMVWHDHCVG